MTAPSPVLRMFKPKDSQGALVTCPDGFFVTDDAISSMVAIHLLLLRPLCHPDTISCPAANIPGLRIYSNNAFCCLYTGPGKRRRGPHSK
jgi:hypothetical protein